MPAAHLASRSKLAYPRHGNRRDLQMVDPRRRHPGSPLSMFVRASNQGYGGQRAPNQTGGQQNSVMHENPYGSPVSRQRYDWGTAPVPPLLPAVNAGMAIRSFFTHYSGRIAPSSTLTDLPQDTASAVRREDVVSTHMNTAVRNL